MFSDLSSNVVKIYYLKTSHLCEQSEKALFNIGRENKGSLPQTVLFYIYDALVGPVLTYGSYIWGFNNSCVDILDKVFILTMSDLHYQLESHNLQWYRIWWKQ